MGLQESTSWWSSNSSFTFLELPSSNWKLAVPHWPSSCMFWSVPVGRDIPWGSCTQDNEGWEWWCLLSPFHCCRHRGAWGEKGESRVGNQEGEVFLHSRAQYPSSLKEGVERRNSRRFFPEMRVLRDLARFTWQFTPCVNAWCFLSFRLKKALSQPWSQQSSR